MPLMPGGKAPHAVPSRTRERGALEVWRAGLQMERMEHSTPLRLPAHLQDVAMLAGLLERLERQPLRASAAQYRQVAQHLSGLLAKVADDSELEPLLRASPAASALYENMRYAQAGLCRAPLEQALNAELAAAAAISRARLG